MVQADFCGWKENNRNSYEKAALKNEDGFDPSLRMLHPTRMITIIGIMLTLSQ